MLLRGGSLLCALALLGGCSDSASPAATPNPPVLPDFDPLPFVDPFIGSFFDFGQMSPAAALPFGLV